MNTSSPESHSCPCYPLVSSFMFCLQAELHSLFWMIFLSPSLGICFLSSSSFTFTVCTCACVCLHVYLQACVLCASVILIMCFFICPMLMVCSCKSSLFLGKKASTCINAFLLLLLLLLPLASHLSISPSVLLCSQSDYTFSFSLSQLEENGNHQPQMFLMVLAFAFQLLNFFFLLISGSISSTS